MNIKPKDGGPALARVGNACVGSQEGMSLRAWLAGMAMQGLQANPRWAEQKEEQTAKWAVCAADALLAELQKDKA